MGYRVLITPPGFAKNDPKPMEILKEQGYELVINPYGRQMTKEEMLEIAKDFDAILIGTDPVDADIMKQSPKLKIVSKYGVGIDNIDSKYAEENSIAVRKALGANSDAVADTAFAMMMAITKKIIIVDAEVRRGEWNETETFEMNNKTLGLLGSGYIGKGVAKRASGFDMKILVYDVIKDEEFAKKYNVEYVSLERLLKESDFISVHVPLLPATRNMISTKEFEMMKPKAVIVNTARGGIIDEDALLVALKSNRILGAGLDVFVQEPIQNKEWFTIPNVVLSSHCAADTYEATHKMSMVSAQNVIEVLNNL